MCCMLWEGPFQDLAVDTIAILFIDQNNALVTIGLIFKDPLLFHFTNGHFICEIILFFIQRKIQTANMLTNKLCI